MSEQALLDRLEGEGEAFPRFPDLDQRFRLKPRSFVEICMPGAFERLGREVNLFGLRQEGIFPIMFHLDFHSAPTPLVYGLPVRPQYTIRLHRYRPGQPESPGGPSGDRLLLDLDFAIRGPRGSGDPGDMHPRPLDERLSPAGRARIVQVLTRPMAPAGERQVSQVPAAHRYFAEHPWAEPYPNWEALSEVPEGFREAGGDVAAPPAEVWGLPNTDINQHVNVVEYITRMEAHQARLLFGAGVPVRRHRITRQRMLFRKPFFAGEPYRLDGRLWRRGEETLFLGRFDKDTGEPPRRAGGQTHAPAVFIRLEGRVEPAAGPEPAH